MGLAEIRAANAPQPKQPKRRSPRVLSVEVTSQVFDALDSLRESGLFGDGKHVETVAEELLRWALRQHEEFIR